MTLARQQQLRFAIRMASLVLAVCPLGMRPWTAFAAEIAVLNEANWHSLAPQGKEVDAIYGDFVLRNDRIVAVVARPVATRHANLRVRKIGGGLLDLTRQDAPNDQLIAMNFAPGVSLGGGEVTVAGEKIATFAEADGEAAGRTVELKLHSAPAPAAEAEAAAANEAPARLSHVVTYQLADGDDCLTVITECRNEGDAPATFVFQDVVYCDGEFKSGIDADVGGLIAYDRFWGQAYCVVPEGAAARLRLSDKERPGPPRLVYGKRRSPIEIAPGETARLVRRVFPAVDHLQAKAMALASLQRPLAAATLAVRDAHGPVAAATVRLRQGDRDYGAGRTNASGELTLSLPPGSYEVVASHDAHGETAANLTVEISAPAKLELELPAAGYVVGTVVDGEGAPIPCKVDFARLDDQPAPDFGPDSAEFGVRNLVYSPNGQFRVAVRPGKYSLLASHGPEYDAVVQELEVAPGEDAVFSARLPRTVDTRGWLSAEYHSHSSPSGDNTASQKGRVMNLLAEHLEFAPCTEHNRISTYVDHLHALGAAERMITCSGMELTGQPLPLNHQNAFPLIHHPHTQNGGGPEADVDPVVQIERLAMWDDRSDKLVQTNHPNIPQMLGDKDLDGQYDGGFARMFDVMDVIEIHPLRDILAEPERLMARPEKGRHAAFHWLQLLNLGIRTPGVVNTDAHWNFHGSGWHRNYVKSRTDDPAEAVVSELVHASEHGQIVMTNGPFLEVRAETAGGASAEVGGDLPAPEKAVTLCVRVQCPNWLDVNRVQIFVNGRPEEQYDYRRATHGAMFGSGPVKFDQRLSLELPADAHLVVVATGDGLTLGRVMGPAHGAAEPIAVSNPIFVDVGGDGFQPNGDTLGVPLPTAPKAAAAGAGHQHPHPH